MSSKENLEADVVLIGAGIMSATLGLLLKELKPNLKIEILERLDKAAVESSDAWNNAGTGHAAFCELNYTPEMEDGTVDASKAVDIVEQFEVSRQFWSYLVSKKILNNPEDFIHSIPHMSFVWGKDNVSFLKKRYEEMIKHPLFKGMEFSDDVTTIKNWAPLLMKGRSREALEDAYAATSMKEGTDVNFGNLTRKMFDYLKSLDGVTSRFSTEVVDIKRSDKTTWNVSTKNIKTNAKATIKAPFVFIGAGGGSILLLQKANIPESEGFGGFPVGGQWLRCTNEEIINKHMAKVYGKASVGAPPMSVPHLDTRFIDGKRALLFGPYAGFSTKFLKTGSLLDLFKSLKCDNIFTMLGAGMRNMSLTHYLISEVLKSKKSKVESLKEYFPDADMDDWEIEIAGQRVQVIKKGKDGKGVLQFGTEVVSSADGSIAALLGASPGASTAAPIMIHLLEKCFPEEFNSLEWKTKFKEMIPSFGIQLNDNPELAVKVREETSKTLKLYPFNN
ncbi:malate:quinone oxidoreductase [Myroides guanonis]|uniref:Probable malate:quinone oxidoreductase n=1 Tax=Myroides guanonis TaxID=1150112 RepID=A0A1I3RCK5_9FLAO|nr:malate:quinone oxidoreductase [Myroides guanonis]SFJ43081.1 malate dehydrogenase (quinone) [Myroides guanonis]